jgi:hypothetical protein
MTEKVGHTAAAVTKGGYFAELDKAIAAREDSGSATAAVQRFFGGESGVDTLIDDLNLAAARGEQVTFSDKMLANALEQVPGLTKANAAIILAKAKDIKARTEKARASAAQGKQIRQALMAKTQEGLPSLADSQQTYVQRIAALREQHKRESGAPIVDPSPEARITPAPAEKLIG